MTRAVFFDRDGVINADRGYVGRIADFVILPGVPETLCWLRQQGFLLILITNQSGIGRGFYTEADFIRVNSYMQQCLRLHQAQFDAVYYCPHHPQAAIEKYRVDCNCRKPKTGMFRRAMQKFDIEMSRSVAVGDRLRDLEGPAALGVQNLVLVGPGETGTHHGFTGLRRIAGIRDLPKLIAPAITPAAAEADG